MGRAQTSWNPFRFPIYIIHRAQRLLYTWVLNCSILTVICHLRSGLELSTCVASALKSFGYWSLSGFQIRDVQWVLIIVNYSYLALTVCQTSCSAFLLHYLILTKVTQLAILTLWMSELEQQRCTWTLSWSGFYLWTSAVSSPLENLSWPESLFWAVQCWLSIQTFFLHCT